MLLFRALICNRFHQALICCSSSDNELVLNVVLSKFYQNSVQNPVKNPVKIHTTATLPHKIMNAVKCKLFMLNFSEIFCIDIDSTDHKTR
jgi:hypothetical protein